MASSLSVGGATNASSSSKGWVGAAQMEAVLAGAQGWNWLTMLGVFEVKKEVRVETFLCVTVLTLLTSMGCGGGGSNSVLLRLHLKSALLSDPPGHCASRHDPALCGICFRGAG